MTATDGSKRAAAADIILIVAVLIASKELLLQIDRLWTFAGPISLVLTLGVALWRLRARGIGWPAIGLSRPQSWGRLAVFTLLALVVTIVAGEIARMAADAWIGLPDATTQDLDARYQGRFSGVSGNPLQFALWLALAWIVGGFTEEILFRGVLFSRLQSLLFGLPLSALLAGTGQAILFGQQHYYYQGAAGWVATSIIALVSSLLFLFFHRNLWPLILSHGLSNSIGLTMLFLRAPG